MNRIAVARELLKVAKALAALNVGKTEENKAIRVTRTMYSFRVFDLTNAGKRGKKVDVAALYDYDWAIEKDPDLQMYIDELADRIMRARSFDQAVKLMENAMEAINDIVPGGAKMYTDTERGVDVTPPGFKKIRVNGKHVDIEADFTSFSVRDKDDQYNLPTCIPAISGGKRDIKVFYRWVMDNERKLKNMTFREVVRGMSDAGIKYHQYCAMD